MKLKVQDMIQQEMKTFSPLNYLDHLNEIQDPFQENPRLKVRDTLTICKYSII